MGIRDGFHALCATFERTGTHDDVAAVVDAQLSAQCQANARVPASDQDGFG